MNGKRASALAAATILTMAGVLAGDVPPGDPRLTPVVLAYRKARAAVVNISTEQIITTRLGMYGADPFDEIFPSPFVREVPVQSLGSGVVMHAEGYIVTNAHVVRRAQKITVTLEDKTKLAARVISADAKADLAVLKVDPPKGGQLPSLPLGRSDDLMVGETVIAIGNPMGYANSLSTGVISATDRTVTFQGGLQIGGLIQTDAPINPGNSGGPLLNVKGELIGINTAIRGDAQNIGFAIPVDALADELVHLLDYERLNRVIVGAVVAQRHGKTAEELRVVTVQRDTPADGQLRVGDQVLAINGKPMQQVSDFACQMLSVKPGDTLTFKCLREGKEVSAAVTVKAKPRPDGGAMAERVFGMTLRELTPQLARDLRLPVESGLLVSKVEDKGPADLLGLKVKDVVFQVERLYVKDLDSLGLLLEEIKAGDAIKIGVIRGNVAAWVQIRARTEAPGATTRPRVRGST
jgi:serine protease Do